MALSGKLAQTDFESYVDVAAIVSEGVTKEILNSLSYSVHLTVHVARGTIVRCEDHQSKRPTRAGNDYLLNTNCKKP